jgi:hypothetical protein
MRSRKCFLPCVAFVSWALSSIIGTPAQAIPITVNFSILDGAATVATGSLQYSSGGPTTITSFGGFTTFSITFDGTDTYTLSQLSALPAADQWINFNTTTNTFGSVADPNVYNIAFVLYANNGGSVDFDVQGNPKVYTDAKIPIYDGAWTAIHTVDPVPEPITLGLFGAGLLGLGVTRRRRKATMA